jgi:AraC-like DNA-binding protein
MKLYIKHMISLRCKMLVQAELKKLGLIDLNVDLGIVELKENLTNRQRELLKVNLLKSGLELLEDKKTVLMEKIKSVIVEMIHYADELPKGNYSDYISDKLNCDYSLLAKVFTEVQGITIQQFIMENKIEKAKEMLLQNDITLTEISERLDYSSVAHLSTQFKKITGTSPTLYKQQFTGKSKTHNL